MKFSKYIFLCLSVGFLSCKAHKISNIQANGSNTITESDKNLVIANLNNTTDFSTLKIKAEMEIFGNEDSKKADADIRIEKDKKILISISKYFVPGFKILFTPDSVDFYNLINKTYFSGDYSFLHRFTGVSLSFQQIQHLILGESLFSPASEKCKMTVEGLLYKLTFETENNIQNEILFNNNYKLSDQNITDTENTYNLMLRYSDYDYSQKIALPGKTSIEAQQNEKIRLVIKYNKFTLNEKLNFPFQIPENYTLDRSFKE